MWGKIKKWTKKAVGAVKSAAATVWHTAKKVARAVATAAVWTYNVLFREPLNRLIGIPELVANLFGWMPEKHLRINSFILNTENGIPLTSDAVMRRALLGAEQILKREANTIIFWGQWPSFWRNDEPAPSAALTVHCDSGAAKEDFGEAGSYFKTRSLTANTGFISLTSLATGYGGPVTVFFVRDVLNKRGCSLGPLSDYVVIDTADPEVIAHEIGHACGLWHIDDPANLMQRDVSGRQLRKWQKAIFRNSRHVTFL